MTNAERFAAAFGACPLVAVLRGVQSSEVEAVGGALIDAGITLLEVPLNAPEPFESITRLAALAGDRALVGAGGVLDAEAIDRAAAAGAGIAGSPVADQAVIAASLAAGMVPLPGVFTPGEAFAAAAAGARTLRFFPAEAGSPAVIRALKTVLPRDVMLVASGGMTPEGLGAWMAAGTDGFGLGAGLWRPGVSAEAAGAMAARFVAAVADARTPEIRP